MNKKTKMKKRDLSSLNRFRTKLLNIIRLLIKKKKRFIIGLLFALILILTGYKATVIVILSIISIALDLLIHSIHCPVHFNTYLFFSIVIAYQWGYFPFALIFLIVTGPFPEIIGGNDVISDYLLLGWTMILAYFASISSMNLVALGLILTILEQIGNGVMQLFLSGNPFRAIFDPVMQVAFNAILFFKFTEIVTFFVSTI
jgi:hypothetical protein